MKNTQDTAGAATLAPVQLIKVSDIVPDPNNRKNHDADELSTLAASIEQDGLLQAIVVRPIDGGKFMLIAGERRWCAHRLLKRVTIEARVSGAAAGAESTRKRLAENFHRVDLSPIEKARDLAKLEADGMSQKDIAAFVGAKDQSTVSNFIRLLQLPKSVQTKVHSGELSGAHAKAIARFVRWPAVCEVIAGEAIKRQTPSKELESGVPFEWALKSKGLVALIDTSTPYSFDARPKWSVPAEYQKDPDFVKERGDSWVCFAPKKWEEQAALQKADWERNRKTAAKGEASKQSKMSPAEKKARQKKIADNKACRAEIADTLERSKQILLKTKDVTPALVQALADIALQANHRFDRFVEDAAKALQIALPKVKRDGGYYRTLKYPVLQKIKPVDAARLVALVIITQQSEEAGRFASGVPGIAELIAGKAKKGAK